MMEESPTFSQPATEPRLIHRLLTAFYRIPSGEILNNASREAGDPHTEPPPARLFRLAMSLKASAIAEDGRSVDYASLRAEPAYLEYRRGASGLQHFDPAGLNGRREQLAFWINLYNALTLDAVIQFQVEKSVQEVRGFFWRAAYRLGGWRFAAHDIEHGILRANRAHPAIPGPHFGSQDRRRQYSLANLDSRVHFALVCASKSCPPIAIYSPEDIDSQLDLAAKTFINFGGVEIDSAAGTVSLSRIFQWYAPDFGAGMLALGDKSPLLAYAARYLASGDDRDFLLNGSPRVQFQPYDWSLNRM